jgi:hypothetical protein
MITNTDIGKLVILEPPGGRIRIACFRDHWRTELHSYPVANTIMLVTNYFYSMESDYDSVECLFDGKSAWFDPNWVIEIT